MLRSSAYLPLSARLPEFGLATGEVRPAGPHLPLGPCLPPGGILSHRTTSSPQAWSFARLKPGRPGLRLVTMVEQLPQDVIARLRALDSAITPELAQAAIAGVLGAAPTEVVVASQDEGFAWLSL